jgi:hypothetical protein
LRVTGYGLPFGFGDEGAGFFPAWTGDGAPAAGEVAAGIAVPAGTTPAPESGAAEDAGEF